MKNFSFKHQGKEFWYSRSLACNLVVFRIGGWLRRRVYVLANRRGQGCEFNKGLWNVPGGFIDFDEDAIECAIRETKEECEVDIPREKVRFINLNTNPKGARQTMVASHVAVVDEKDYPGEVLKLVKTSSAEADRVMWINIKDLDKYNWVPGQKEMIRRIYKQL